MKFGSKLNVCVLVIFLFVVEFRAQRIYRTNMHDSSQMFVKRLFCVSRVFVVANRYISTWLTDYNPITV